MAAKVYLIGAGPGDPGLITVRAVECLRQADVVVYDYLSNAALLQYARADAKLLYVGKKGFTRHVTQDQINQCLVEEALGKACAPTESNVVLARLKGGDPFVFGRGGEEALALRAAGIDFEVVPGITAGIAAPAYAGIPVTHRKVSSSVAFITGNEDPTKDETSIDWQGIANGAETLCFYMGIRNLPSISARLIGAGRNPHTPVALVRWGTLPKQEVLRGTLADIAKKAQESHFMAPAIILVGEVARLRDQLAWKASLPLAGRTIAITRTRSQASDLARQLRAYGAEVIECPTIEVVSLEGYSVVDTAIGQLAVGKYQWLVLTSTNGVDCFFGRLTAAGLDARTLARVKVAAIGAATAKRLAEHGIHADLVPSEYRAEAVAQDMNDQGAGACSVLIARAEKARDALPKALRKAGASVDVVPVYRTAPSRSDFTRQALRRIAAGEADSITFTSTSTVKNFIKLLEEELEREAVEARAGTLEGADGIAGALGTAEIGAAAGAFPTTPCAATRAREVLAGMRCYSIGPVTSKTLTDMCVTIAAEASPYTIPALVGAIVSDCDD